MQKWVSKKSQNRIYNLWNNHSFYMDGIKRRLFILFILFYEMKTKRLII